MSASPPPTDVFQETQVVGESRLSQKLRESPLMGVGMAAWIGIVGYGLYTVKNRKHGLGVHLIHTRVFAQGAVVGALTIGVIGQLYSNHFKPWLDGVSKKKD